MRNATSTGFAALCAVAAAAFFVAVKIAGPIVYIQFETLRHLASGESSWDVSYPTSWHIVEPLVAAALGFAVGAFWFSRRRKSAAG